MYWPIFKMSCLVWKKNIFKFVSKFLVYKLKIKGLGDGWKFQNSNYTIFVCGFFFASFGNFSTEKLLKFIDTFWWLYKCSKRFQIVPTVCALNVRLWNLQSAKHNIFWPSETVTHSTRGCLLQIYVPVLVPNVLKVITFPRADMFFRTAVFLRRIVNHIALNHIAPIARHVPIIL